MIEDGAGAAFSGRHRVRPIRTLAVLNSFIGGGAERQMMHLLKHLDRARFDLSLCVLAAEGPLLEEVPDDVRLHVLGKQRRADLPRLVVRLARLLRAQRPDLIISKVDYANIIASLAVACARRPIPLVLGEESVPSAELLTANHRVVRRSLITWSYRRATLITAPSAGVLSDLRLNFRIHGPELHVIPNMIDYGALQEAGRQPHRHAFSHVNVPLIVAAGRLAPSKGQADLLEAVGLLGPDHPCNLLLLGEGDDMSRLKSLARGLRISDRVHFAGFVANPYALMAQADIFVSPSHFESFGNVILEAMALGVAVLSTKVPFGPEELISDGETGLFAPPHDPRALAQRIEQLLDSPKLRASLAANAKLAAARYDTHAVLNKYVSLLEKATVLGSH